MHSSQLHRWCSGASVFFAQCQESKPGNPLRFKVVTFPFRMPWRITLLFSSCLASSWVKALPVEGTLEATAAAASREKQGKWRAGGQKYSDTVRNDPHHCLAPLCSSHLCSLPSPSGNTEQILLTSVWATRRAVAEGDGRPVHDSFSLFFPAIPLSPSLPLTPLKTEENKGRDRRKAI